MTPDQINRLTEAIIALLGVITVAIGLHNNRRIEAVRTEQKNVAAQLSQVQKDGYELRAFLEKHTT